MGNELRKCEICGGPVADVRYQDPTARTCRPRCAKALALKEHPDIHVFETRVGKHGGEPS